MPNIPPITLFLYRNNSGEKYDLKLIFATGRHVVDTFIVVLDGKPVQGDVVPFE